MEIAIKILKDMQKQYEDGSQKKWIENIILCNISDYIGKSDNKELETKKLNQLFSKHNIMLKAENTNNQYQQGLIIKPKIS